MLVESLQSTRSLGPETQVSVVRDNRVEIYDERSQTCLMLAFTDIEYTLRAIAMYEHLSIFLRQDRAKSVPSSSPLSSVEIDRVL